MKYQRLLITAVQSIPTAGARNYNDTAPSLDVSPMSCSILYDTMDVRFQVEEAAGDNGDEVRQVVILQAYLRYR